jgi:UDP-N-acetylglucosamine 2-epimerase (non-hydrolysing)
MHRRENHVWMSEWVREFEMLRNLGLKVTMINHPNPNVQDALLNVQHINVIDPLSHDEMMKRLASCKFIITDSGGLQEEGSFFNKRIIVCRETTERSEAMVAHSVLCTRPKGLFDICKNINDDYIVSEPCPFGDGNATEKIMELL